MTKIASRGGPALKRSFAKGKKKEKKEKKKSKRKERKEEKY